MVALAAAVLAAAALLLLLWDQPTPQARVASTMGTHPTPTDEECTLVDAADGIELPGEVARLRGDVCRTVDVFDDLELTAEQIDGASLEPVAGS